MIANLFAGTLAKVSAGIAAVLLIALAWCWIGWGNAADERDILVAKLAKSEAQHAVTRNSVDVLEQEMAEMINSGAIRDDRLQAALTEQEERSAMLREEYDRIRASPAAVDCETLPAILDAKGL